MLISTTRLDVMHRLGRAMADPTRSRILMTLLDGPPLSSRLSVRLGADEAAVGAMLMSASTIVVAVNAQLLRRLDLRPSTSTSDITLLFRQRSR